MYIEETPIMKECLSNLLWVKSHKANIIEKAEHNEEEFGTFILGMGLCYNCELSSIHSIDIDNELKQYYSDRGFLYGSFEVGEDTTLLDILFIKYCIENNQPIDTVWPCGPIETNDSKFNYGKDSERWDFLDYMIENLQYILDNQKVKGL